MHCLQAMFEMYFVFALIWAFGGALCEKDGINYRRNFDKWFKVGNWQRHCDINSDVSNSPPA